jgi:DinB superfamily
MREISKRGNKMNELSNSIANGFVHAYRDYVQRTHALSEKLSEEQFWTKPYPYGNSFGHLTLHITGNLNYYIGAQIAGTGYVRDRELEFTESAPPSKAEVLRRLDETVEMVIATLEAQSAESWSKAYEAENLSDFIKDRFSIFLRCATHFHHHVGQMIYLEKEFSK